MATTKTPAAIDKREAITKLTSFFQIFQAACNQQGPINASTLEPYLSKNFQLTSNDRIAARSLSDYLNRLARFQKKFSHVEVAGPAAEPLISGNKIAIQYTMDLTYRDGKKSEVLVMALGTIEDNKIANWTQVTHEKGSSPQWDA
jgi:hypothetical protein